MPHKESSFNWQDLTAVTTAIIAVLAAITSLHMSSTASLILLEKNNSNYFQAKANKEWNYYLANDITSRVLKQPDLEVQKNLQREAESLEQQAEIATKKASAHFERNGQLTTAGTFFEIAIALSAMSVLLKNKPVWVMSLLLSVVGIFFLFLGVN